jgi:RNA polymerase sigma-70 factor (ECF subfamily)
MTNHELHGRIHAVAAGDRTVFEEIYNELSKPMYTIILRITREESLAEDVLQEVFVKLFQSPPTAARNPRAYLFQMARNLAIDSIRKSPQFADLDDIENLLPSTDTAFERMEINEALGALPPTECQIVSLHINGGLTFREISGVLGLPLGTALWRYHRALGQLRSYLS